QLEIDAHHLAGAGVLWFFHRDVRAARARYRRLTRGRKDPWRTMPEHLHRLANHARRVEAFEADPRFRQMLGAAFKGLGSDFTALQGAVRFVDAAVGRFMSDAGIGGTCLGRILRADV